MHPKMQKYQNHLKRFENGRNEKLDSKWNRLISSINLIQCDKEWIDSETERERDRGEERERKQTISSVIEVESNFNNAQRIESVQTECKNAMCRRYAMHNFCSRPAFSNRQTNYFMEYIINFIMFSNKSSEHTQKKEKKKKCRTLAGQRSKNK